MKKIKSPLRYPGGKTRAVDKILPHLPKGVDLCSPFFGGGSIEIAYALENPSNKVYGYDLFEPIVCFQENLLKHPIMLYKEVCFIRERFDKDDFYDFRNELRENYVPSLRAAAQLFAINRTSFSGATFSGGFSKLSNEKRFTQNSMDKIRNFRVPNLTVSYGDFKDTILKHDKEFLYLDPPYLLDKGSNNLYGSNGSTHKTFDHEGLLDILKTRTNWIMSYNDCEWVRDAYKGYEIQELKWNYGMNKSKKSSEILIKG